MGKSITINTTTPPPITFKHKMKKKKGYLIFRCPNFGLMVNISLSSLENLRKTYFWPWTTKFPWEVTVADTFLLETMEYQSTSNLKQNFTSRNSKFTYLSLSTASLVKTFKFKSHQVILDTPKKITPQNK